MAEGLALLATVGEVWILGYLLFTRTRTRIEVPVGA